MYKVLLGDIEKIMKFRTRVFSNKQTTIPPKIRKIIDIEKYNVVKWNYNPESNYIRINFVRECDIDVDDYNNQIIYDEDYMIFYRKVIYLNIHFPAEIEKGLNFDYTKNVLLWILTDDNKIYISKSDKENLIYISGIIKE